MPVEPFLRSSNLERSIEFYTQVLDFQLLLAPCPDLSSPLSNHAIVGWADDRVHLSKNSGDGVFGSLIYIRVNNVDEIYTRFMSADRTRFAELDQWIRIDLVEQSWGMKEFGILDPDQNKITFGQQTA